MKRESIYPCIISLILALIAIIAIYGYAKLDYENRKPISSASISETLSITPTTMPSEQSTVTVESFSSESDINSLLLPGNVTGEFKSYEDFNNITRQDSKQYALKQFYWLDEFGFYRLGEYYAVAMGTYYAEYIGETLIIELEDRTIKVIIGDVKWDGCIDNMYHPDGSILEFVINTDMMNSDQLNEIMAGRILSMRKEVPFK